MNKTTQFSPFCGAMKALWLIHHEWELLTLVDKTHPLHEITAIQKKTNTIHHEHIYDYFKFEPKNEPTATRLAPRYIPHCVTNEAGKTAKSNNPPPPG